MEKEDHAGIQKQIYLNLLDQFSAWGDAELVDFQRELFSRDAHNGSTCEHILRDVARLGPDSLAWASRGLDHPHVQVRLIAIQMATRLRDESLVPQLARHLLDASEKVPPLAEAAILACAPQRLENVQPVLDQLGDPETMKRAFRCLCYPHSIREIHDALLAYLDQHADDKNLYALAIQPMIQYLDKETVVAEMRQRLGEPRTELVALFILEHIGAAPDLRPYLEHPDVHYQRAAVNGLMRLGLPEDRLALRGLFDRLRQAFP